MAEYRAKETCFVNGSRIRPGAIVTLPDDAPMPSGFEPVGETSGPVPAGALRAEHRGFGKWAVVDAEGKEIDSGLTKIEAQARAAEGA